MCPPAVAGLGIEIERAEWVLEELTVFAKGLDFHFWSIYTFDLWYSRSNSEYRIV